MACCGGIVGAAKAVLGIDRAAADSITHRVRLCLGHGAAIPRCEHAENGWRCGACGCVVKLKIRVASEHCPVGKW